MKGNYKIRNDKRTVRILRNMLVADVIIFIVSSVLVRILGLQRSVEMEIIWTVEMVSCYALLPILFCFLKGLWYLKMLEKKGYLVPENAREYHYDLRNLPYEEPKVQQAERKREPLYLVISALYVISFVGFVIWMIDFSGKWLWVEGSYLLIVPMTLVNVFWLWRAYRLFRMSDNRYYQWEFDRDETKIRRGEATAPMIGLIVLGFLQCIGYLLASQLTNYVYQSGVGQNHRVAGHIAYFLAEDYADLEESEKEIIYLALEKGMDLGNPSEECRDFVDHLWSDHGRERENWKENFRYVGEDSKILAYVDQEGEMLYVALTNVEKEDGRYHNRAEITFEK